MATPEVPHELLAKMLGQIAQDPGLPAESPTIAAWQEPSHPLTKVQSKNLVEQTDFAIIGSGITGCSVAKHLLENDLSGNQSVTVFEARQLTTGATSRNGGFLMSHAPTFFAPFAKAFGTDAAVKIARFCERTLAEIVKVAEAEGLFEECQIRDVTTVLTFQDQEGHVEASESLRMYQECVPEFRGTFVPVSNQEAEKEYGLKSVAGAFTTQSRVFWPYRFVTGVFQHLLDRYSGRFSVETGTPVTSITVSQDHTATHPYTLTTPRGTVLARHVFHCTSGFASHLLPKLRGPIFPCRLTMSCSEPGPNFGIRPISWLWRVPHLYDADTQLAELGLYWMQQNAVTGDLFYGGDVQKLEDYITSNDSAISPDAAANLTTLLPDRIFSRGWTDNTTGATLSPMKPRRTWCGILSMTADQMPIVGRVPTSVSGRGVGEVGGEWIAAGFNGYGMGQCWSCGEAIARMALGEGTPPWLPEVYASSEERLSGPAMGVEAALGSFFNR